MAKMLSPSGGLCLPDQGLCPWTPLGALPPDPRYRLVLALAMVSPQPLTPSAAYGRFIYTIRVYGPCSVFAGRVRGCPNITPVLTAHVLLNSYYPSGPDSASGRPA